MVCDAASLTALALWVPVLGWMKNAEFQLPNPRVREREFHPCVNLHQEKYLLILWNREILMFASCPSNLWEPMFDFRKYFNIFPEVTFESSRSPICSVEVFYPRDYLVESHSCDECRISNELNMST